MLVLTACKQRTPRGVKRGKTMDKVFVKVDFETVHRARNGLLGLNVEDAVSCVPQEAVAL